MVTLSHLLCSFIHSFKKVLAIYHVTDMVADVGDKL